MDYTYVVGRYMGIYPFTFCYGVKRRIIVQLTDWLILLFGTLIWFSFFIYHILGNRTYSVVPGVDMVLLDYFYRMMESQSFLIGLYLTWYNFLNRKSLWKILEDLDDTNVEVSGWNGLPMTPF